MRSATVFEDIVKTICTVNCHWRNTKLMVSMRCSTSPFPHFWM